MLANHLPYATVVNNMPDAIPHFFRLNPPDSLEVCKECWKDIRAKKMPRNATCNGLFVEVPPLELSGLNFIERILIQRVRPLQVCIV
jgi:hypothetical protein